MRAPRALPDGRLDAQSGTPISGRALSRLPDAPVKAATGAVTLDARTGAKEGDAAGDVTVGNGSVALHLGGSGRRTGDFRSPDGDVPNSFSRAGFAPGRRGVHLR